MEEDTESMQRIMKILKEVKVVNWGLYKLASEEKVEVQKAEGMGC